MSGGKKCQVHRLSYHLWVINQANDCLIERQICCDHSPCDSSESEFRECWNIFNCPVKAIFQMNGVFIVFSFHGPLKKNLVVNLSSFCSKHPSIWLKYLKIPPKMSDVSIKIVIGHGTFVIPSIKFDINARNSINFNQKHFKFHLIMSEGARLTRLLIFIEFHRSPNDLFSMNFSFLLAFKFKSQHLKTENSHGTITAWTKIVFGLLCFVAVDTCFKFYDGWITTATEVEDGKK